MNENRQIKLKSNIKDMPLTCYLNYLAKIPEVSRENFDNRKFSKQMISQKIMTNILCGNLEKSFLELEKMPLRKIFRHFLNANVFSVFLV